MYLIRLPNIILCKRKKKNIKRNSMNMTGILIEDVCIVVVMIAQM